MSRPSPPDNTHELEPLHDSSSAFASRSESVMEYCTESVNDNEDQQSHPSNESVPDISAEDKKGEKLTLLSTFCSPGLVLGRLNVKYFLVLLKPCIYPSGFWLFLESSALPDCVRALTPHLFHSVDAQTRGLILSLRSD